MMKQNICKTVVAAFCAMVLLVSEIPSPVLAAGESQTVYVTTSSEYQTGDGTSADAPLKDINQAFEKVADGGEVVIMGRYVSQTMAFTPKKSVTVRGDTEDACWTVRYGLTLGGDLRLDQLHLETTSTDRQARYLYVDGNRLEMTQSVNTMVNGNYNQRPILETRSDKNRSTIVLASGNVEEIAITGEMGADVTLKGSVCVDKVTASNSAQKNTIAIQAKQTFIQPLENIEKLTIAGGWVRVPALVEVENLQISGGMLEIQTDSSTVIAGELKVDGGTLSPSGAVTAGSVTGHGCEISRSFTGTITSNNPDTATYFFYKNGSETGWEIREKVEDGKKIWYAAWSDGMQVCYVDGKEGDDALDGLSADTAVKTIDKALEKIENAPKIGKIVVCGDTEMGNEIPALSTTLVLEGLTSDVCINTSADLKWNTATIVENITLNVHGDILLEGDYYEFGQGTTVVGRPNVYVHVKQYEVNQIDIMSGAFANIISVTDLEHKEVAQGKGILSLYGGGAQGISGWESLFLEDISEDIQIGGDIQVNYLTISNVTGTIYADGMIQTQAVEILGLAPTISMMDGKRIETEDFILSKERLLPVTIRSHGSEVDSGIYIRAKHPIDGTITLLGMPGYTWGVNEEHTAYTLTKQPTEIAYTVQKIENGTAFDVEISGVIGEYNLFAAIYDADGCLVGIDIRPLSQCGHYDAMVTGELEAVGANVFLWGNDSTMSAKCTAGGYQTIS